MSFDRKTRSIDSGTISEISLFPFLILLGKTVSRPGNTVKWPGNKVGRSGISVKLTSFFTRFLRWNPLFEWGNIKRKRTWFPRWLFEILQRVLEYITVVWSYVCTYLRMFETLILAYDNSRRYRTIYSRPQYENRYFGYIELFNKFVRLLNYQNSFNQFHWKIRIMNVDSNI